MVPNYTTNGMHLSEEILDATNKYSGGLAISYHPHIKKVFHKAISLIADYKEKHESVFKVNVHIILGSEESFVDLKNLYNNYSDIIDYFVILPYQAKGRGVEIETQATWVKAFDWISLHDKKEKFAFGALFYNWLLENEVDIKMSIYEPEIYSGYRIMNDTDEKIRNSSYDLREKEYEE